jgi:hypothetical protein
MDYLVVSVFDRVTKKFGPPILSINANSALRVFNHSIKDEPFKKDQCLYYVGWYDDQTGIITPSPNLPCPVEPDLEDTGGDNAE